MLKIVEIIERLRNTSSTNEKEAILKENKDNELLKKVLYFTYHPHMKYKVTEKTIVTDIEYSPSKWNNIFEVLEELSKSNINDNLRREIGYFLSGVKDDGERTLYIQMLLKDLRCNISEKTINKVWKKLIPTHAVMLASKFEGELKGKVAVTTKMDGLRCSAIVEDGQVTWITRQGKIVEGLNDLTKAILNVTKDNNCFLDGELLAINDTGLASGELFRKTTKVVNSKMEDKKDVRFILFDYQTIDEFKERKCRTKYAKRRDIIERMSLNDYSNLISVVQMHTITDDTEEIYNLLTKVVAEGEEGLMLNYIDGMYEYKRSKEILKVKEFFTADLEVIGVEEGTGRNVGRLGALVVDYKGYEVKVGSGFSDEQREDFWKDKDNIIGKIIEVKYFEQSENQNGGISLRFPTFVRLRDDKTVDDISFA